MKTSLATLAFIWTEKNCVNELTRFWNLELRQHLILKIPILVEEATGCRLLHLQEWVGNEEPLLDLSHDLSFLEQLVSDVLDLLLLKLVSGCDLRQSHRSSNCTKYTSDLAKLPLLKTLCHQTVSLNGTTSRQSSFNLLNYEFLDEIKWQIVLGCQICQIYLTSLSDLLV